MYTRNNGALVPVGDDGKSFNLRDAIGSEPVKTASAIALTYHGYRRTGSIVWAMVYGLLGRWIPAVSVPIALAQGYGEKKPCP